MKEPLDEELVEVIAHKIQSLFAKMPNPSTIKEFFDLVPTLIEEKLWFPTLEENRIVRGMLMPFMIVYMEKENGDKHVEFTVIQNMQKFFSDENSRKEHLRQLSQTKGFLACAAGDLIKMRVVPMEKTEDINDAIANTEPVFNGESMFYIFAVPDLEVEITRFASIPQKDGEKYIEMMDSRKTKASFVMLDNTDNKFSA